MGDGRIEDDFSSDPNLGVALLDFLNVKSYQKVFILRMKLKKDDSENKF